MMNQDTYQLVCDGCRKSVLLRTAVLFARDPSGHWVPPLLRGQVYGLCLACLLLYGDQLQ